MYVVKVAAGATSWLLAGRSLARNFFGVLFGAFSIGDL